MHQLRSLLSILVLTCVGLLPTAHAETLRGALQIQLPDGLAQASGDGSIVFRVRAEGQPTISVEGQVQAGRYTVEIPDGLEFQVLTSRTTEGAGYPLDRGLWMRAPESGTYDVIVRIPLDFELWVYGADGRTPLHGITVMRCLRKFARLSIPAPGDNKFETIYTAVDSPVAFRVDSPETYTYYVCAPGHAWTQISPDPHLGGVQTMQLPAGGNLDVQISQAGAGRGSVLRIRDLDPAPNTHPLVHELKSYDDRVQVIGLPVGLYSVSSEDPIRPNNMPIYGTAEVQIQAGETAELRLNLSAEPTFQPVPAAGIVRIPAAWGDLEAFTLQLTRLDPYGEWGRHYQVPSRMWTAMAGEEGLYQWSLPEVAPGAYNFHFDHTSYSVYREIHGAGNLQIYLELPAPRTIRLKTIDDRTGQPIFPETMVWSAIEPEAIRKKIRDTAPFQSAQRPVLLGEDGTEFSIYGPDAPLRIRLEDPRFDWAEKLIAEPGDQEVTWSLHRATGIRIETSHAGVAVQWSGNVQILSESGHGKVLGAVDSEFGHQYNVSDAGRYSIRFPSVPGFQAIPPQTVQVEDGAVLLVEIELTPL